MKRLFFAAILTASMPGSGVAFTPDWTFPAPGGYCSLDPANEREAAFFQGTKKQRILAHFIECKERDRLRKGGSVTVSLSRGGWVSGDLDASGSLQAVTSNRNARIERSYASHRKISLGKIADYAANPGSESEGMQIIGALDADVSAAYIGAYNVIVEGGRQRVVAFIYAVTQVADYPLTVAVHAPFEGEATFASLLKEAKTMVPQFIRSNER